MDFKRNFGVTSSAPYIFASAGVISSLRQVVSHSNRKDGTVLRRSAHKNKSELMPKMVATSYKYRSGEKCLFACVSALRTVK